MGHSLGMFQYNQMMPPSVNHISDVYGTISIALGPTIEVAFGCISYVQYVCYPNL